MITIRNYVANKIREYRRLRGLTQKELGEKIGVKHNTVSSYENGTNEPEQDILFKIASALNISINNLFPSTTTESSETVQYKNLLKDFPDLPKAVQLYTQLDVDDRGEIRGEMKNMLRDVKYSKVKDESAG